VTAGAFGIGAAIARRLCGHGADGIVAEVLQFRTPIAALVTLFPVGDASVDEP
jgi:NAD(P)-dependent dehydrogenase (short-subunit alcohol dehydrogenase family)